LVEQQIDPHITTGPGLAQTSFEAHAGLLPQRQVGAPPLMSHHSPPLQHASPQQGPFAHRAQVDEQVRPPA
jgi:hypothetical protein